MFPTRYFPDRYFAPRYWPKVGATPVAPVFPRASRYRTQTRNRTVYAALLGLIGGWV
jgi:hypothetical protein